MKKNNYPQLIESADFFAGISQFFRIRTFLLPTDDREQFILRSATVPP